MRQWSSTNCWSLIGGVVDGEAVGADKVLDIDRGDGRR